MRSESSGNTVKLLSSPEAIGVPTPADPAGAEIMVRVDLAATEVAGELLVAGSAARPFYSWIELVRTLDGALDTLRTPGMTN